MINNLVYVQDFTGLQPNTTYLLQCKQFAYKTPSGSVGFDPNEQPWYNYYISTDPLAPGAVTFPTIGSSSVSISWNNYSNPSDTSYTIQRRQVSGTWLDVVTGNNISSYTDNGLAQEVTYYYRIRVNNKNGGYTYSNEYSVTTSADPAVAAAKAAKAAAEDARSYSEQAKTSADNASSRTWYTGTYGGSQESVADTAGYIRNSQLPGISTKIDNLTTTVNNMSGADTSAPVVNVQTLSGALATSGSSIQSVVTVTDPNDSTFTYSINGGAYSALPSNRIVSLPVSSSGPNAITVSVKDPAGNVGSATIIIRKL